VGSAAIVALGRCQNWAAAFQIWKDMGELGEPRNLYAYTAMLTVLRDSQRWEESAEVFRAMRDEEVGPGPGPGPGPTAHTVRGSPPLPVIGTSCTALCALVVRLNGII